MSVAIRYNVPLALNMFPDERQAVLILEPTAWLIFDPDIVEALWPVLKPDP
jgi:hypothetical protein